MGGSSMTVGDKYYFVDKEADENWHRVWFQ
jgi:hypothetical protein